MTDVYETRKAKREQAQDMLRRAGGDPEVLFHLAEELKSLNEFGHARRLLARASEPPHTSPALRKKIGQRHALCTYKDPDLPVRDKLERAVEILKSIDDLETTTDQETLGLAGAIYKRLWQVDTNRQHLERSFCYYHRGFEANPEKDYGYTGINAAYVLDLLASLEEAQAVETGATSSNADERRKQARAIRQTIVDVVPALADVDERLKREWWFLVTVAEAHFGLGSYEEALQWLRRAKERRDAVPPWEFESTAVQLASLAQHQDRATREPGEVEETHAWRVLREYLDGRIDAVRTVFAGKFGLALSGGGFRASFYHIGVLAKLAELDLLRHIHVLSCVSGGSIIGTHYYLELRKLLQEKDDVADDRANDNNAITRNDYIALVERVQQSFLKGVQRNLRVRMVDDPIVNMRMAFSPTYSRTTRIGELFEKELYSFVDDGAEAERFINDLKIQPRGEANFNPKERNWLRRNKVPMLVLNATTLNTGHNWQFTASWMGEPPFAIDPTADGNWRYRRMYYTEAPEQYRSVRLGMAVGASACVPGLFEPVALPGLYPKEGSGYPEMTVRLVDGGVHDNQGIAGLVEQDCNVLFVSDASGQATSLAQPKNGVLGPMLRANTVLMERVRLSQLAHLKSRKRASLLKSLVVVHLKKGLTVDPVSWKRCKEPPDVPLQRRSDLLDYGVLRRIQASLAAIRTDLDSFSDIEAYALMASGYLMTESFAGGIHGYPQHRGPRHEWQFLKVEAALRGRAPTERQQDAFEELLCVGAERGFKIWRISRLLKAVAIGLGLIVAGLFIWGWYRYPGFTLVHLDLDWLGWTLVFTLVALVFGKIAAVFQYKKALRSVLKDIGIAVLGWVIAKVHLRVFDPLFLRKGRVDRIL